MEERVGIFVFALAIGLIVSVHLAMNSRAGELLGSVRIANAIFWSGGAICALFIAATSGELAALGKLSNVPGWLWLAGVLGASLVLAIAWSMQKIGVGPTTAALLTGQLISAALISHLGFLTDHPVPLDVTRLLGLAAIAVGAVLVVR